MIIREPNQTSEPSNEYQKLAEAVALLERQLPELDVAAIPTKSEVFTACGGHARALHDAIATVLSALKLPRDAVTISRQRYERLRFAAGEIDSDPELSTFAGEPQDAFKTIAGPLPTPPAGVSDNG